MKSPLQIEASVERFRRGFWGRETLDRPPVGIAPDRVWTPIRFLRAPFPRAEVQPEDVGPALVRTEYEDAFAAHPVRSDDFLPYVAAWRGVPWLEAMTGCPVRAAGGSLAPHRFVDGAADLRNLAIPAGTAWLECLRRETAALAAGAPRDCWISTTILRGCSDVLAAARGLNEFCLDLYDDPAPLAETAARINRLHLDVLDLHFSLVQPKRGGYGHIYGFWAPEPATVIQEDVMGLCAPAVYRNLFLAHNAEIVRRLGACVLFHLHSTGFRHWRDVLGIPGLAGLEITVEANGPSLSCLVPVLREILERTRLVLFVDGWFEELPPALRQLPREGLYLIVSDRFIPAEEDFQRFVAHQW